MKGPAGYAASRFQRTTGSRSVQTGTVQGGFKAR
jgi:hypothetical protein